MIFSCVTRYCIGVSFFSIWSFSSFLMILLGFPKDCWGPLGFHTRGLLGTPPPGVVVVAEVELGEPPGAGVSVPVVPLGERLVRGERLVLLGGLVLRGIRLLLRLSLGEKEVLEESEGGVREERAPRGEVAEVVWLRFPRADTGRRFANWRGSIVTCKEDGG